MCKLTILGATGSIGASTLKVLVNNPEKYEVFALVAGHNAIKMAELCRVWRPEYAVMADEFSAKQLKELLGSNSERVKILHGIDAMCHVSSADEVDVVMAAIVGAAGLLPTMAAVKAGKRVLLANKESLVMSGRLFIDEANQSGAQILPVDSEHSAIFQCLPSDVQTRLGHCHLPEHGISNILLTGSGGPFLNAEISTLERVTPQQAIAHPNWSMGPKVSVDSATMMNKGLEYIEAKWLFNTTPEQLKVIIHPQSIIHSMVQYVDGSVIAQMGEPDMATPIAYALSYPSRVNAGVQALDFSNIGSLNFLQPDYSRYPCLKLAIDACFEGQHATTALNAANEVAVEAFLNSTLKFTDIVKVNDFVVTQVCAHYSESHCMDLESLLEIDRASRAMADAVMREYKK
jgi:1-deoxy-D-xylulose-5-phosphate reductoisomerase